VIALSTSPDTTVELGNTNEPVRDEDVAVLGFAAAVRTADIGATPAASDVTAYEALGNGDQLLCFDTTVVLPGPFFNPRGHVVRYDGVAYSKAFDASAEGVPAGASCDAVSVDGSGDLILSFDTTVDLPGGVSADDEDLVRFDGVSFSLFFDGSAEGIPRALDVDGAHVLPNGDIAVSFDVSGSVGGVNVDDEDVVRFDTSSTSWSLLLDGSAQDPDWVGADAVAVPEPAFVVLAGAGAVSLLLGARSRRRHP